MCLCQFRTWLAFSSFDLNAAAIKQIELKSIFAVMPKLWNCRIMYGAKGGIAKEGSSCGTLKIVQIALEEQLIRCCLAAGTDAEE